MTKVSETFLIRLKLHSLPAWQIAQKAGVSANTLSKLISGIEPVKPKDPRIVAVGRVLRIPASDCFKDEGRHGENLRHE